ncbi:MAG: hypothetical protein GY793_07280 [Proteobacteria bacterium]|nr:hypothetical protein [Pseudomonadota bacterium]
MLKKLYLLVIPFLLISCKEDNKLILQDLLDKKDFINAKKLNQTMLDKSPDDAYYQSVKGYVLSVECLSTNCVKNNEGVLTESIEYTIKNNSLLKVDDFFFVDLYAKTMENIIESVLKQGDLDKASEILGAVSNPVKNKRIKFIYNYLFNRVLDAQLKGNSKKAKYILEILESVDLKTTKDQNILTHLLKKLMEDESLRRVKQQIKAINRSFVDNQFSGELLVSMGPALVKYIMDKGIGSVFDKVNDVNKIRGTILGENASILKKEKNNEHFARGIELVSESDYFIQKISKYEGVRLNEAKLKLQKISLAMNYDNDDLWKKYAKHIIEDKQFSNLYKNFIIERVSPEIIVFNNNLLLEYSEKNLKEESIIPQIDEIVFREDSNKEDFKKRSVSLVESALKHEMNQDNLERIFSYFTYFPDIKEKFKDEISQKIKTYIDNAWEINDFVLLDKLLKLDKEIESVSINNVLKKLFDDQLNKKKVQAIFMANTVTEFLQLESNDKVTYDDLKGKYKFIKSKIDKATIRDMIMSASKELNGDYSKSKLFIYFYDTFSKDEGKNLVMGHISSVLASGTTLSLGLVIELANYLTANVGGLSDLFIEDKLVNRIQNLKDLTFVWVKSSKLLKNSITKYDYDIKRLIGIINNDGKNKKISAAVQMGKIKSDKVLELVSAYKKAYLAYVDGIKGYYVKTDGKKGPEVIHINNTKDFLKVSVGFVSKLGDIEKLDKYKLDRGAIISKLMTSYYNPTTFKVGIKNNFTKEESRVFGRGNTLKIKDGKIFFVGQEYEKVSDLFKFDQKYGIVEQLTITSMDNFHLLPEGAWFKVVDKIDEDKYKILIGHPANKKEVEVDAVYDIETLEFSFEYKYYISAVNRTFEVKSKCQLLGERAYCAVQDKNWKREKYSVILKALEVVD